MLYNKITEFSANFCTNCTERFATCPECGCDLCVFCDDACVVCGESIF